MTDPEHALELAAERATQRAYSVAVGEKVVRTGISVDPTDNPFTRTGFRDGASSAPATVFGRIALGGPNAILDGGADFYIGSDYHSTPEYIVYPWTAPVACTFFERPQHHDLCEEVAVRRTFASRLGEITDFEEEALVEGAPKEPFRRRGLSIPEAPNRPLPEKTVVRQGESEQPTEDASLLEQATPRVTRIDRTIRAGRLLRAQLAAPRSKSLAPTLATLQPEQYELVTKAGDVDQIIEGQPGTGKTIIASHRAAYLVTSDPEVEDTISGDLLIVGPTPEYSRHIRDVVSQLADRPQSVRVLSLPELTQEILGLKEVPDAGGSTRWEDVDLHLALMVRSAITRLKSGSDVSLSSQQVYDFLRANGTSTFPLTADPEWQAYLAGLPIFRDALARRRHLALMAFIKWEVASTVGLRRIDHIIVDEAQDVTPLEWILLSAMHRGSGWTILGDLNQRRSDHTVGSWTRVIDLLGLEPSETQIRTVKRGYRSTKPILEYANQLLPKADRPIDALQTEGPAPAIRSVSNGDLMLAVRTEADRLLAAYPDGTCAVITTDPNPVWQELRVNGWRLAGRETGLWESPKGRQLHVIPPDVARGREWDAVTVVEPSAFPENVGRLGPLYTALTRPNRELAIVHSKPLPDGLRRR